MLAPLAAQAGAWLQPEQTWYIDQKALTYRSTRYWDASGHPHPQPAYHKIELGTYAEYGFSNALTLGGSFALDALTQSPQRGGATLHNSTLNDPSVFARYKLYEHGPWVFSAEPQLLFPTQSTNEAPAPQSGSHTTEAQFSLRAGRSLMWRHRYHYIESRVGLGSRQWRAQSAQVLADISAGIRPFGQWLITFGLSTRYSLRQPEAAAPHVNAADHDYRLLKAEAALSYEWDNWRLYGGAFRHMAGQNTGAGLGFMAGAAYRVASW